MSKVHQWSPFVKQMMMLLLASRPIQWFVGRVLPHIRFSIAPPECDGEEFKRFISFIQPGDLVFSMDRKKLASVIVPGYWDHVGIVTGDYQIVEAHMPKVRKIQAYDFCHTSDEVGILRPQPIMAYKLSTGCQKLIGIPYDTFFADGREALYCSELVWNLDPKNELGFDTTDEVGLGIGYVAPDDLWNSKHAMARASMKSPFIGFERIEPMDD